MNRSNLSLLLAAAAASVAFSGEAAAQYTYSDSYDRPSQSPELFVFELRIGGYTPDVGNGAFDTVFGGDIGPMIGLELDFVPFRIPYVGLLGAGVRFNWAKYTASGCLDIGCTPAGDGMAVDQELEFRIFPLQGLAVLRVDVLARELNVPLIFTGKIGFDTVLYRVQNGSTTETEGYSFGLHWGAQVALELDFINPRRARTLDDEWGHQPHQPLLRALRFHRLVRRQLHRLDRRPRPHLLRPWDVASRPCPTGCASSWRTMGRNSTAGRPSPR